MKTSDMDKKDGPPFSAQAEPWFVIFHGEDMENQTFYSISEHRYYVRSIPELGIKEICTYVDEWLVLFDFDSRDYYIWNAISNDKIQFPPSVLPYTNELQCLISAPPDDSECRVMFIDVPTSSLYFCKLGYDEEFHKQDLQPIIGDDQLPLWTVFKRKFYGLIGSILVHLDIVENESSVRVTPMANMPLYDKGGEYLDMPRWEPYLIQSHNANDDHVLYCIHKLYTGWHMKEAYGFLVFGFDFGKRMWIEMKSIGETAIFLHDSKGTSCSTKGNGNANLKRDSIYFTQGPHRRLYVFNLETKQTSISLPCPTLSKKQDSLFYWLKLPSKSN